MSKNKKKKTNNNNNNNNNNNIKKVSFINNPKQICFKCLQEKNTITIPIHPLGYDSFFDNWGTEIHLCQDCIDSCIDSSIWDISSGTLNTVKKVKTDTNGNPTITNLYYSHENEIVDYINQLPIQSQELVFNRFSWGSSITPMKPQDWIDYQLGLLSHEDSKKYGLISLDELKAYYQKFPVCKWVRIITEKRTSSETDSVLDVPIYSICTFNCMGDNFGQPSETNMSPSCYNCPCFKQRNNDEQIKSVDVNSLQRKTIVLDSLSQLSDLLKEKNEYES